MNWFKIYREVSNEIEFLTLRIDDLSDEYKFWYRQCHTGHRKPVAPLDNVLKRMNKIIDDVAEYEYLKRLKENTLEQMDKQLSELGDREKEVVRLHEFEGLTHFQIAHKMGISEIWVKRLSAEGKRKLVV